MGKRGGNSASASGFAIVVAQAESNPDLAVETGIRVDLPPALRDQLLRKATVAVRARLLPATTITPRPSRLRNPASSNRAQSPNPTTSKGTGLNEGSKLLNAD